MQEEMMRMMTELLKKNSDEVESTKGFRSYDDLDRDYLKQYVCWGEKEPKGEWLGDGTNFKANDYRFKKLKMPIFDGDDAYGWIYRMERFFKIQGVEALEQLQVAELCLEGEALSWYCWSEGRSPFRSWEGLKRVEGTARALKPDLRASVRVMHPEGLNHAMILAVTIEENKGFDIGARGGGSYRSGGTTSNFSGYKNNTTSSPRTLLSYSSTVKGRNY
ncbi:hypothetical protein Tco_1062668 [Tanacetum coccineum]